MRAGTHMPDDFSRQELVHVCCLLSSPAGFLVAMQTAD